MTPKSAKQKGRSLQNKVRDKLLEKFSQFEPDDIKSTAMGQGGVDVQLSPAAQKVIPYAFECKKNKSFAVYKIYDQAKSHKKGVPIAVIEADRRKPLVVVDLDVFLELISK